MKTKQKWTAAILLSIVIGIGSCTSPPNINPPVKKPVEVPPVEEPPIEEPPIEEPPVGDPPFIQPSTMFPPFAIPPLEGPLVTDSDYIARSEAVVRIAYSLGEDDELKLQDIRVDFNGNRVVSFYQYYKGLRVRNHRCVVRYKGGSIIYITGNLIRIRNLSVEPLLSEAEALQSATSYIGAEKYIWESEQAELNWKEMQNDSTATRYPKGELIIYLGKQRQPVLVYEFVIEAITPFSVDYVFVNAVNGEIEGTEPALIE